MAEPPVAKRARAHALRASLPYISQRALADILAASRDGPLPVVSRTQLQLSRDEAAMIMTPYGPLHQTIKVPHETPGVAPLIVEIQHPFAMFYHSCRVSKSLSDLVRRVAIAHPPSPLSPWHLILYSDEVTPGNAMAYKNLRRTQAVYWTALEWGCAAIADEEAWFEFTVVKSTTVKTMLGGMSGLTCAAIKTFFAPDGLNFATGGITLLLFNSETITVWITFGIKVADESDLHSIYLCKGASGLKCCLFCSNVFNAKNERGLFEDGVRLLHTTSDVACIVLYTKASLAAIFERLERALTTMHPDDFKELETVLGWSYVKGGVMLDPYVRDIMHPTLFAIYDWMHGLFVNGVFNKTVGAFMRAVSRFGTKYATLYNYASLWNWPRRLKNGVGLDALTGARAKSSWEHASLRVSASEGRSLLPVIGQFARKGLLQHPNPEVQDHARCLVHLLEMYRYFEQAARCNVDVKAFQDAVVVFLTEFRLLYGEDAMIVKFHWLLHFPMFLKRHGSLPNCFCLERKHKVVKKFADNLKPRVDGSATVLRDVTAAHLHSITEADHFCTEPGLMQPTKNCEPNLRERLAVHFVGAASFSTSLSARINEWEVVGVGDVVLYKGDDNIANAGRLAFHVAVSYPGGAVDHISLVEAWSFVDHDHVSSRWRRGDRSNLAIVLTKAIVASVVWSQGSGDIVVLLHPPQLPLP